MDFKCFHFDDESAMLLFVDRHWHQVFNVEFTKHPDNGEIGGWCVRLLKPDLSPKLSDILGGRNG